MAPDTVDCRARTDDIAGGAASFAELLLPAALTEALGSAGFGRPSPVQSAAIPLARLGVDLIVQAKSGTGKTLVYAVAALERVKVDILTPQVMVVTPTREIALQSHDVISRVAAGLRLPGLKTVCFIGGQPAAEDEKRLRRTCQIVVGTPGRLCALLEAGKLPAAAMQLLVLDEADSLLAESFTEDIEWLKQSLPAQQLQTLALSATYTPEMLEQLESWMVEPQRVMLCEETVSLKGVKHFFVQMDAPPGEDTDRSAALQLKLPALVELMSGMTFHQAVVFCNRKGDGERLAAKLTSSAFPAAYISGSRSQQERTSAMTQVRGFQRRVLVSTDLTARGVDLARVNLVVNLDLPPEAATLLHRIGRTGRWGSRGVAVTFCLGDELPKLRDLIDEAGGGELEPLPTQISEELYRYELESAEEQEQFESLLDAPLLPDPDEVAALEAAMVGDEEGEAMPGDGSDAAWDYAAYYNYWYGSGTAAHQPSGWPAGDRESQPEAYPHAEGPNPQWPGWTAGENPSTPWPPGPPPGDAPPAPPQDTSAPSQSAQYEKYLCEYHAWTAKYSEWRDQYRLWLYNFHMEAAYQAYYGT
eukprot:jgi/Tetstr1/461986/TSEL_007059.t1